MSDTTRTERLTLVPLEPGFVHVHDRAECFAAHEHWAEHGFGTWAILIRAGTFAGVAEMHYADPEVVGISPEEVEVGWSILPKFAGRGYATEAGRAAIVDVWTRAGIDHVVAGIRPENEAAQRVAQKLGFTVRGEGLTRSGDPMTVLELRAT